MRRRSEEEADLELFGSRLGGLGSGCLLEEDEAELLRLQGIKTQPRQQ